MTARSQGEAEQGLARAPLLTLLAPALLLAPPVPAQEPPHLALVPLTSTVTWDATLEVDAVLVNKGTDSLPFPLGDKVRARLSVEGESWPLMLTRDTSAASEAPVPPGGFAAVRYHAALPGQAHGRAVLEIIEPGVDRSRAVIDIIGGGVAGPSVAGAWNGDFDHHRLLSGRLSINQPIYIILGPKFPKAKFQVSFKYRLVSLGAETDVAPPHSVQLGYTQRSLWQLGPFYDNSYMPEIMYQWLEPTLHDGGGVAWRGLQAGWLHESNGRGGDDERNANIAYVRPLISVGTPDGWHALIEPQAWFYFFGLKANPDLYLYRGNSSLRVTIGKGNGSSLAVTVLPGEHFSHGSRQLDLTIPVHLPLFDFSTYVMVQYFDGYAESLINYQGRTSALRAGIEFVR